MTLKPIFNAEKFLREARGEFRERRTTRPTDTYNKSTKPAGYFTTAEVAKLFGMTKQQLAKLRASGNMVDIPYVRSGNGSHYYETEAVLKLMNEGQSLFSFPDLQTRRAKAEFVPNAYDNAIPDDQMGLREFAILLGIGKKTARLYLGRIKPALHQTTMGRVMIPRDVAQEYARKYKEHLQQVAEERLKRLRRGHEQWLKSQEK